MNRDKQPKARCCSLFDLAPTGIATTTQRAQTEEPMSENVFRVIEIVGSSADGVDGAITSAVSRASKTLHGIDWFEVLRSAATLKTFDGPFSSSPEGGV
jgi:flavin-binding protein dodecin